MEQVSVSRGQLAGVDSERTIFASRTGYPIAVRSEWFQRGRILVNVYASAPDPADLTSGPVEELFQSVRFQP